LRDVSQLKSRNQAEILPDMRDLPRRKSTPLFLTRIRAKSQAVSTHWLGRHAALSAIALTVAALLVWLLSPILAPFLAAGILAYIFNPVVNRMAALMIAVALLLMIILPLFYKEIAQLTQLIPNFLDQAKNNLVPWINAKIGVEINLDPSSVRQFIQDNLSDASGIAKRIFSSVGTGGLAVVGALVNLGLIPVVFFYVVRDWPMMISRVDAMIPRRFHQGISDIAIEIDAVLSEFLRGQLLVMLIMSAFYVTGLWAVGLKFALPVGLITGLMVFIPYLGVGLGMLLGTIAAVMQYDNMMVGVALVWAIFGVGQIIESFLVTPKFVGERIGLHPVAVIFALLAFGQVFGFFGILLALPASAAILVGLRHLQLRYQRSSLFTH
jgi:predicted PurR-regulated permease PerM